MLKSDIYKPCETNDFWLGELQQFALELESDNLQSVAKSRDADKMKPMMMKNTSICFSMAYYNLPNCSPVNHKIPMNPLYIPYIDYIPDFLDDLSCVFMAPPARRGGGSAEDTSRKMILDALW